MTKALITGGTGFIGLHLARYLLDQGLEVVLLDNLSRGRLDTHVQGLLESPGARFVQRDLLTPFAPGELDTDIGVVFHLAAMLGVQNVRENPYEVLRDNTLMTMNLLDAVRGLPTAPRVVYASTSEVYAGTLFHFELPLPTPETTPLAVSDIDEPRTSYMLSKIYGEALCRHSGLPWTVIRPHNVYGPRMGMAHVIPEMLKRAREADAEFTVWSVEHSRTFCFVSDAVAMLHAAAFSPQCENQVLNVGSQEPEVTMGELAGIVLRALGKDLPIAPLPSTPGSPPRRCPDMAKTHQLTGVAAQVGLEQGVAQTLDWYERHVFAN